jgi:hypothetical protein
MLRRVPSRARRCRAFRLVRDSYGRCRISLALYYWLAGVLARRFVRSR